MSEGRRPDAASLKTALLQEIRDFLEAEFQGPRAPKRRAPERELQLAGAVLMVCMLRADHESRQDEHRALERGLARAFRLDADATARLLRRAEEALGAGVALPELVGVLRDGAGLDQRKDVVQTLWRVAFADAELAGHEEYLVRKLADLLGLSSADLIETKVAAREAFLREDL